MYVFLHGAEMQPEQIRATWPEARFVARARLAPRPLGPAAAEEDETWGIVLEARDGVDSGGSGGAVTDDGRALPVVVLAPDDADPAAVIAAARYWELPPDYVRRLARIAAVPIEDESEG